MAFLDQNKGKTLNASRLGTAGMMANNTSHHTTNVRYSQVSGIGTSSAMTSPQKQKKSNNLPSSDKGISRTKNIDASDDKKIRVSPFHVVHNFYLDQLQREKVERQKLEAQQRERVEKQKKKRMELIAKMKESGKTTETTLKNSDWTPMGGLGANTGTDQWLKKTELHNKMLNFSKDINKINLKTIKCVPFISLSHLHQGPKHDPRSLALEYSRGVPLPKVMVGQRVLEGLPRSASKDEISELEKLDMNHLKYMEMMKQM